MSMEEYRADRNLPASPYLIHKTAATDEKKRKTNSLSALQATFNM